MLLTFQNTSVFEIDGETGIITLKSEIDCRSEIKFEIRATDGGIPSLSASAEVIVEVESGNEIPPLFEQGMYNASIGEDADIGTCLLKVGEVFHPLSPLFHRRPNLSKENGAIFEPTKRISKKLFVGTKFRESVCI